MKSIFFQMYRAGVEGLVRYISSRMKLPNAIYWFAWSVCEYAFRRTLGRGWLWFAVIPYLLFNLAVQATLSLSVRSRTGKWPRPRLTLTTVLLACLIVSGSAFVFGAADKTWYCMISALGAIAANVYFSDYHRKRRALRRAFARFTD